MPHTYLPLNRLRQFVELLGLGGEKQSPLEKWSEVFLPHADEFALGIETFVMSRPQLRIIRENQHPPTRLNSNWMRWYSMIFSTGADETLMTAIWRSGQAHVVYNVDHRYVSLAYNIARAFCHEVALKHLPMKDQPLVLTLVDKMIDFSILVETDAFVTYATQCELEVIQGISHQVRNPISVIGGKARKLLKLHPEDTVIRDAAETILAEAVRLEHMARNVSTYMDITRSEARFIPAPLEAILAASKDKVEVGASLTDAVVTISIDPKASVLSADPAELTTMFTCLLENAFHYADPDDPRVDITATTNPVRDGFAIITIANNGETFNPALLGQAFSPFHSSAPMATGFGLPMARVIASKYSGNITLAPMEPRGTKSVVTMPLHPTFGG